MLEIFYFLHKHKYFFLVFSFIFSFFDSLIFSFFLPYTLFIFFSSIILPILNISYILFIIIINIGMFLGDLTSLLIGRYYKSIFFIIFPFLNKINLVKENYSNKWLFLFIFISKFVISIKSLTSILSGVYKIPILYFQSISLISTIIWTLIIIIPGKLFILNKL